MSPWCRTGGITSAHCPAPVTGITPWGCKILGDGILDKILGGVKIPHVGSRRSSAQFTCLQGCNSLSYLSPSRRSCGGQGWFFGPQTAWKFLSAAAAPSFNTVLVFDHPDPNGSQAGPSVTSQ